ncbi:hypothetical protein SISSUDRAFT_1031460 [Sistotremastrum suecicum HHB10207 ss-3]|uniref:Uncharacterized protein n=1 Tax=Sistotremastrum suecicum HHB10207 ss-3 TaxID=1314776 RepID=A0A166FUU5_9AGAM|nr:hypothetical protein SISSUDRAFT_1031460 [Sistotremastrum suecicum HHB10207 ss-3]
MSAFALLLTAQVGLTLLLLILLLAKIRRAPALYNFIFITWLSVPIYLLFHGGWLNMGPRVVLQVFVGEFWSDPWKCRLHVGNNVLQIIGLPYVNFLGCSIAIFVRGETYLVSNYDVVPYSFYCTLNANGTVSAIETAENAVIILVTLFYEVRTALVYRKLKKVAATLNVNNDFGFPDFVRLGVFTFWLTIG